VKGVFTVAGFPMYAHCKKCKLGYKWYSGTGVPVRKVMCPNCGERVTMLSNPNSVLFIYQEWIDLNDYVKSLKK
jgi:transcription elongation factor Elf1